MTQERRAGQGGGRRSLWLLLLAGALILCGTGALLFPRITDWMYRQDVERQLEEFRGGEKGEDPLLYEELYQELKRRNEQLYQEKQEGLTDPFSYEQPDIDLTAYGLEDNVIGFVHIPKMEVTLPILLGANQENLSLGAAHLTQTSYPIGGSTTNSVLAAHRGYSKAAMFRDIEALEIGDEVIIENFRETLMYEVCELKVISPVDVEKVLIREGRDMVTLITCHPYRHNYQRYVVYCERKE